MIKRFSVLWLLVLLAVLAGGCKEIISLRYSFEQPGISGNLPKDNFEVFGIRAYVRDGHIQVRTETALTHGYDIDIVLHVKADNRQEAESMAQDVVHYEADEKMLQLTIDEENINATVTIKVPQNYTYDLNSKVANGSMVLDGLNLKDALIRADNGMIEIRDINARSVDGATSNGRIRFLDSRAEKISLKTSNGLIEFVGEGKNAFLQTANGRIALRLLPTDYINYFPQAKIVVRNSNGSIGVQLPEEKGTGYNLKATTDNGRVKILMRGFEAIDDGQWRTLAFVSQPRQINLDLATSNADINIERNR